MAADAKKVTTLDALDLIGVSETPYRLNLTWPNGDPMLCKDGQPAWIDVYSANSSHAKDLKRMAFKSAMSNKKLDGDKGYEEAIDRIATQCATLTAGWRLVTRDGDVAEIPYTYANGLQFYRSDSRAYIRDQVQKAMNDDALFMKG